jgi:tRNA threonylcarbamoyl adenosine modification protein YeaZ
MRCLLIDTSGRTIYLGVADSEGRVLSAIEIEHSRINSRRLAELTQEALSSANTMLEDVAFVCVGNGPGSFIGTRSGVAYANGLASTGIKVLAVGSMEAAAAVPSVNGRNVMVIREARRQSVFAGAYTRKDGALLTLGEREIRMADICELADSALEMAEEKRVQVVTDCRQAYDAFSAAETLRAAVVLKLSIVDVRGMALLAAERWAGATGFADVRYLRPAV